MSIFDGDLSIALSRLTSSFGSNPLDIAYLTQSMSPFAQHRYPALVACVERVIRSKECVRSSAVFVSKLKVILDHCVVEVIESNTFSFFQHLLSDFGMLLEYAKREISFGCTHETCNPIHSHSSSIVSLRR
jgi:hypothetical protein